ncbi:hypothetical protein CYJ68_01080 [Gardnerella vaginalis]|nr:hypothetical protein CYJ68_01080 [Gardnerella vaginalis]
MIFVFYLCIMHYLFVVFILKNYHWQNYHWQNYH